MAASTKTKGQDGFWSRRKRLRLQNHLLTYLVLVPGALLFLYPLLWMLSTSLKPKHQIFTYPIEWIPDTWMWSNYGEVFNQVPFWTYTVNTAVITVIGVVGTLFGSSLAAYGFARFRFPGRDALFLLMLSTMMVPIWVTLIPSFLMFRWFGWLNSYLPILVPAFFAQPFYTFLLRQFFMTVPVDLEDSARIDGANRLQIFLNIMLPLSRPALATAAIFAFFFYWNEFSAAADLHSRSDQVPHLGGHFLLYFRIPLRFRADDGGLGDGADAADAGLLLCAALLHPGLRLEWGQRMSGGGLSRPVPICRGDSVTRPPKRKL